MKDGFIISALSIVPKNHVSRRMGKTARIRLPRFLHRMLIRWFVWKYEVDLDECEGGIDDFPSLSDFFLRALKEGVRKIDMDPRAWISPVDGCMHIRGDIEGGRFRQSESQFGDVSMLLGEEAGRFADGQYAIVYLSPQDYHRVHSPQDGLIRKITYCPGRLWPVFPAATRKIPNLFDRNERLVFFMETAQGSAAMVMVGAFGVGRMSTSLHPAVTNVPGVSEGGIELDPPRKVVRGEELGRFELGSTVILLWEGRGLDWEHSSGDRPRLGAKLAAAVSG
jgi:phosphatidylserine decarboxylase